MIGTEAMRAVLVDRDGVLNRNRDHYVRTPDDLEILPGVPTALRLLKDAGYAVLVLTNQQGVAKGLIPLPVLEAIHAELRRRVGVEGGEIAEFFVCTHASDAGCACRKPLPGLVHRARDAWGFDPAATYFVGDAKRDVEAARAADCKPVHVLSGIKDFEPASDPAVPVFEHLEAFARFLVAT